MHMSRANIGKPKFRSTLVKHFYSDFSLILVLQFKTSKIINGMANISIKSQEITPFGGIFHVMEKFDHHIGPVVDGELGFRCTIFGYQYSEMMTRVGTHQALSDTGQ